jgi:glycosyltransferase involved in cell wall biosynthesis
MEPLVSIITPSFNQARFLEQALQSVLGQGYPRLEYLVVDGGSTDGSLEILRRYRDRLSGWTSEPDQGQADAINKGLRRARGEIVAWLNSDDAYLPGALVDAVAVLEGDPSLGMVYADGLMVDSDLHLLDRHRYPEVDVVDLLSFEVILQPTVFMRREAVVDLGYLNPSYHLILDHEFWVRMAARYPVRHIPEYWAIERTHTEAKTIARAAGFVEEAERLVAWAEADARLSPVVARNHRRIRSGLEVFAARRLIDAGQYRDAVRRYARAIRYHPPTAARYWYKFVQGLGSALGMASAFEGYRRTRRRVTHRGQVIELAHLDSMPDNP